MKVNSVKKAEMIKVNRRTTMAGHINLKLSESIFFIGNAAMDILIRDVLPRHKSSALLFVIIEFLNHDVKAKGLFYEGYGRKVKR